MFAILLLSTLIAGVAGAHPGGVDTEGCHKDSRASKRHCHPERSKQARKQATYDSEHPPRPGDEGVFYGPLVAVIDGDTFSAKVQGVVMKFRLQGVDAPEHDQPYGAAATATLRQVIADGPLVLVYSDVDRYGRIVAQAWVDNVHVNAEMVRSGAAWFDSEYSQDEALYRIETDARDKKTGLWALPSAKRVEPWVWRREKR